MCKKVEKEREMSSEMRKEQERRGGKRTDEG